MFKNKFLMKALALTVALTIVLTPVTALAEGMKEVNAEDQDRIEDLGDVKADGEKEDAVEIWADGHKAEVTTGSLESADRNGLFTYAEHNAEINVDVKGDINTPAEISPEKSASGVTTNALWGSSQDINVNGNIISGDDGITVKTSDRYEGDAAEQGDFGDSRTNIKVNGNITADSTGIEVTASLGGENHIEVIGDVKGFASGGDNPENDDGAIWATANNMDSRNDIAVKGDVTGDKMGVWMLIPYENSGNPENNVVIDGTLSAKQAAVIAENLSNANAGKNTITVWKIETPGYTAAKWEYNEQDEENPFYLVEDEEAEKNIQYIIRVNQTENATLTATDADGNALARVTGAGGSVLEYAHEGDKVLLKIDVADGYQLDAAYGDEGRQLELVRDANDNYYINVPRNGGVSFSVRLSKKEKKDDHDDKKDNDQTAGTFVHSDSTAVSLISATPAGGSVTLSGLSGTGLSASVVSQLLAKRDINVTLTFTINGVTYQIVIPAGADISKLVGADGSISFAVLGQAFRIAMV